MADLSAQTDDSPSLGAQLLDLLRREPAQRWSLARLAKRFGLAQSQLRRQLTELDDAACGDGLGLLRTRQHGGLTLVELTELGQATLSGLREPHDAVAAKAARDDAALSRVRRQQVRNGQAMAPDHDQVIEEAPVALLYNGHAHVVMMLTPVDLVDFALGYSLAEGIVDSVDELRVIETTAHASGFAVHLQLPQARFDALPGRSRSDAGSASCGLCGTRELADALRPVRLVRVALQPVPFQRLQRGFESMRDCQVLNADSGAVHAAALLLDNDHLLLREDIGRHTAVDKVIGAAVQASVVPQVLLLTSRLSYEIVRKAAQVGIHTIAVISGPSGLALRTAHAAGITVWGFVRGWHGNHYL